LLSLKEKKMSPQKAETEKEAPPVSQMVEDIVGCKWSLGVIDMIRKGINRPGAMERGVDGLTAKVLNERLRKLVRYGIVERKAYPEIPPRVEYNLTSFGEKFTKVLDAVAELEATLRETEGKEISKQTKK
jgi:DNA-binding HxlR family transcriptional regulator